jgi:hypothetical protein
MNRGGPTDTDLLLAYMQNQIRAWHSSGFLPPDSKLIVGAGRIVRVTGDPNELREGIVILLPEEKYFCPAFVGDSNIMLHVLGGKLIQGSQTTISDSSRQWGIAILGDSTKMTLLWTLAKKHDPTGTAAVEAQLRSK